MAIVLVVDDEEADRMILGNIAHGMGHEVHFASDGVEALEVYGGRKIDVVVTDLQMPRLDGLELIEALHESFPDAKIVAVSGKGRELLGVARDKGVVVALGKPVDPNDLLRAIAEAAPESPEPVSPRWVLTR